MGPLLRFRNDSKNAQSRIEQDEEKQDGRVDHSPWTRFLPYFDRVVEECRQQIKGRRRPFSRRAGCLPISWQRYFRRLFGLRQQFQIWGLGIRIVRRCLGIERRPGRLRFCCQRSNHVGCRRRRLSCTRLGLAGNGNGCTAFAALESLSRQFGRDFRPHPARSANSADGGRFSFPTRRTRGRLFFSLRRWL